MTESVFPFIYWAIGAGLGAGHWPADGGERITGGSPRYHLYETRDGKLAAVAVARAEVLGSRSPPPSGSSREFIDDRARPGRRPSRASAEIIAGKTAAEWLPIFDKADCCCSIVQDIRAALDDPHFKARGAVRAEAHQREGRDAAGDAGADRQALAPRRHERRLGAGARRAQCGVRILAARVGHHPLVPRASGDPGPDACQSRTGFPLARE